MPEHTTAGTICRDVAKEIGDRLRLDPESELSSGEMKTLPVVKETLLPSYRVYVIELADAAGPGGTRRNPARPCVYVGQSAKSPEDRFAQHKRGERRSRCVERHGLQLLPALYNHLPAFTARAEAEAGEKACAEELKRRGYTVRGGH